MTLLILTLAVITSVFAWHDHKTKNISNLRMATAYVLVFSVFNIYVYSLGTSDTIMKSRIFLILFAVLWGVSLFSFFVLKTGGADAKFLPLLAVLAPWDLFWVLCSFFAVLWVIELYNVGSGKKLKLPMFPVLAVALWMVIITSI